MLSTLEPDPTKTAGTIEEYRQSETVRDITEALAQRYYRGGVKYGTFIDDAVVPTEITGETSFAEMAYNELQDGITYAYKALKVHEENETMLSDAAEALRANSALIGRLSERVEQLEAELELTNLQVETLTKQAEEAEAHAAQAEHDNMELVATVTALRKEINVQRGRATRLGNAAKQYQQLAKLRNEQLNSIPKLVRSTFIRGKSNG